MADVAAMDIVIGAKIDGAIKGLDDVQKKLAQDALAAAKVGDSLDNVGVSLISLGNKLKLFESALNKATDPGHIAYLKRNIDALKGSIEAIKNIKPLEAIPKNATDATNALSNMSRIVQDAPFGFIAISNNLNPMLESFQRLQKEAGGTGAALKSMASALTGPAGIGIALAAIEFILIKYPDLLSFTSTETKKAAEAQKAYGEAMRQSLAPAQTQIIQLNSLLSIARDSSQSLTTQRNATTELVRLYPQLSDAIKTTGVNSGTTTQAVNNLTQSLILQAKAQAILNLITKQQEKSMETAGKKTLDYASGWDRTKDVINGIMHPLERLLSGQGIFGPSQQTFENASGKREDAMNEEERAGERLEKQLKGLELQLAKFGLFKPPPPPKTEKLSEVAKILDELHKKQADIQKGVQLGDILQADAAVQDVKALNGAIVDLMNLKLPPQNIINQLLTEFDQKVLPAIGMGLEKAFGTLKTMKLPDIAPPNQPIDLHIKPAIDDDQLAELKGEVEQFYLTHGIELPVNLKWMGEAETKRYQHIGEEAARVVALGFKLPEGFEFLKDEDRENLVKEFEDIAKIVKDAVANTFITIAENIGNLKNPLAGIFELLGNSLIELGKQVVVTSGLVATISKALNAAFGGLPAAGFAVGIGLIITGSLLKHFAPFAEGGIVTGPTRALIGEAGPEVVFPLDRLREFIQPAQSQIVVLETRVRGSDIWLSQSRTNERRDRTY